MMPRHVLACLLLVPLGALAAGCRRPPATRHAEGPVIRIDAAYAGASARTVADDVAAPIEVQLDGAEGLARVESESGDDGTYSAVVRFGSEADPYVALTLVQNRVALAGPLLP